MNCILQSGGHRMRLSLQGETVQLPALYGLLEVNLEAEGICQIGLKTYQLTAGTNAVAIPWSNEETSTLRIICGKESGTCLFRRIAAAHIDRDTSLNLAYFSEQLRRIWPNGVFSVDDFVDAQKTGKLRFLTVEKPRTSQACADLREKLRQVLIQHVQAICTRPKHGTHTEEIVQDVSLVKRISTNTISHLSSHTEHWKAKKLTGLVPKRLLSVTIEDDINIYENLFFRMAIDDIADYVAEQKRSLETSIRQSNNVIAYETYEAADVRRAEMLRELLGSDHYDELYLLGDAEKEAYDRWVKIAEIVQAVRNSAFYRQIDRHMRISRNVHQTNILRHDQHYKALFQTWKELRNQPQNELSINATKELPDDPDNCYTSYVFLLLLWTMKRKMGIRFAPEDKIQINGNHLEACLHGSDGLCRYEVQTLSDRTGQNTIQMQILPPYDAYPLPKDCRVTNDDMRSFSDWVTVTEGSLEITREADPSDYRQLMNLFARKGKRPNSAVNASSWECFIREVQEKQRVRKPFAHTEFNIRPLFYSLPLQDDLLPDFNVGADGENTIWVTATNPERGKELSGQWIRRVLNYGDTPDDVVQEPYREMFLPISQADLLSAERLEKSIVIHRAVLLDKWFRSGFKQICPSCLQDRVRALDQDTFQCQSCGHQWGKTRCQGKCGQYFLWRQPGSECWKRLQKEDVQPEQAECMRVIQRDLVFGDTIITDFEYRFDQYGSVVSLYPVCPLCGSRRL